MTIRSTFIGVLGALGALGALVLVTGSAGCGRLRYSYAPVTTTSAEVEGHSAALIDMPPDAAKGQLRIASLGVANVTPPSEVATGSFRALFVRFVVVNDSEQSWTFDEAEQRVEIIEGSARATSWPRTVTGSRPSVVAIPPHVSTSFDVLFPIGSRDEGDVAHFDVQWTVRQGARPISGRSEFKRHLEAREPAPAAFEPSEPPPYRPPPRTPILPTTDPCLP